MERALGSYAIPGAGATLEATEAALREQTDALAHDGPSAVELERMRKACRPAAHAAVPGARTCQRVFGQGGKRRDRDVVTDGLKF